MGPRLTIDHARLTAFCQKWKVAELSLFGSVIRPDFRSDSDVDVLVCPAADAAWTLFDWVEMRDELAAIFGRSIDLVSTRGLRNPFRRREILSNREVVFAA